MVTLRVPATTANLGPGFDSFGCALSLYNTYTFSLCDHLEIQGCPPAYCNEENLTVVAFKKVLEALGEPWAWPEDERSGRDPRQPGIGLQCGDDRCGRCRCKYAVRQQAAG